MSPRFIEKVQQDIPGHGVKEQLQTLCNVYALYILHKHLGDFLATGCITPRQGALANEQLGKLYAQVYYIGRRRKHNDETERNPVKKKWGSRK